MSDYEKLRVIDSSVLEDDLVDEVDVELVEYGTFGEYQLVGHGDVTNIHSCGKFRKPYVCSRVELHNRVTLDGVSFKGKVYVKATFFSCDKPSCPVCFKFGWAVREARKIEARLAEASKRFGVVEHIVASVPSRDYGLCFEDLRAKTVEALFVRGVVGGVLMFHGFRYNIRKQWYWSPHFHVLGFIFGGYARCRYCKRKWNCLKGCSGFDDRSYQYFLKDGYYVKVLGKRKSVYHTAWYQLNHATVKKGVERFHVASWFGVCSYRKLKVTVELKKAICPICKHDLAEHNYFGHKDEIRSIFRSDRGSCCKRSFHADYEEDGRPVWFEVVKHE